MLRRGRASVVNSILDDLADDAEDPERTGVRIIDANTIEVKNWAAWAQGANQRIKERGLCDTPFARGILSKAQIMGIGYHDGTIRLQAEGLTSTAKQFPRRGNVVQWVFAADGRRIGHSPLFSTDKALRNAAARAAEAEAARAEPEPEAAKAEPEAAKAEALGVGFAEGYCWVERLEKGMVVLAPHFSYALRVLQVDDEHATFPHGIKRPRNGNYIEVL